MKLIFQPRKIALLFAFLAATSGVLAQTPPAPPLNNPLQHVNQQMRDIFTPLYRPAPVLDYLYDMSGHFTDDKFWTNLSYDSSSTDNWFMLYWEHYYMAYDTTPLPRDTDIYENVLQFRGDTIQLGVLDKSYYQFVPGALNSNQFFDFDSVLNTITDRASRVGDPYIRKNLFAFAPLFNTSKYGKITWVIDPGYIFNDPTNTIYYDPNTYQFQVNFGDGNGFITFDPTIVTYHTVDYAGVALEGQDIALDAQIMQDGLRIKHSRSKFVMGKTDSQPRHFDEVTQYGDLSVKIYRSCNSTPQSRKIVIFLEGWDMLDFIPKLNRTADEIFHERVQDPNISQLMNFGYDFYVVDWPNSRIDIRTNAMNIVNMLDLLKDEVDNDYEFVIIGESMGGLVARYALSYMESSNYLDPLNYPNAHERDRMHNCRLMITLDSPHQGANLPLSIQHMYNVMAKGVDRIIGIPMLTRTIFKYSNLFLDGMAAKQMLIYHINTKSLLGLYHTYTHHQERSYFLNDLAALGNYPQFCKKLAMADGALNGEMQCRASSFTDRIANDYLMDFSTDIYARILWFIKVPVLGADLELRTNPNGQGQIFQMNAGTWGIKLKFYLFGVKLITGYNSLVNISEYASTNAYCVNSGGWLGSDVLDPLIGNSTNNNHSWRMSKYWILNLASFRSGSDGTGCWSTNTRVGFEGFASANFDLSICSDGLLFCFVPIQSALDYGTLGSVPLNHDFETDLNGNTTLLNANTPFDVIVANGADDVVWPLLRGPHRLNMSHASVKYNGRDDFLDDAFEFTDCPLGSDIFGHWVNREIGDETFFLDNYDCSRSSIYESEYELYINTFNNPWYTYAGGNTGSRPGFYSKSNYFEIRDNVHAEFRYDFVTHNPPFVVNYIFNTSPNQGTTPYQGTWSTTNSPGLACGNCQDFGKDDQNRGQDILSGESFARVYPNPTTAGMVTLSYKFVNSNPAMITITNMSGQTVYTKTVPAPGKSQAAETSIDLYQAGLSSGVYIVNVSSGPENFNQKLVVE